MSELDKLFRDKLSNREFEFKDTYWDAAEQLIEQQEKRNPRGAGWWRWGALLLLLVSLGIGYFLLKNNTPDNLKTNLNSTNISSNLLNGSDNSTTNLISEKEETAVEQLVGETETDFSNAKESTPSNLPVNDSGLDSNKPSNSQNTNQKEGQSNLKPSNYNTTSSGNNFIKKGTETTASPTGKTVIPSLKNKPSTNLLIDTFLQQKVDTLETVKKDIALDIPTVESGESIVENEEIAFEGLLPTLKTKAATLEMADPDCEGCFDLEELSIKRKNKLRFGLIGEGLVFAKKVNEETWSGGSLGGFAKYHLKPNFIFRTGLQYSLINIGGNSNSGGLIDGIYDPSAFRGLDLNTEENQYSFGLRSVRNFYTPQRFHYIEMPLVFQLRKNRHSLEAGTQISFLLGARGSSLEETSLFPWEQDELELNDAFLVSSNSNTANLPIDNYKRFGASLLLGYEYQVSPRFSVHFNSQFTTESQTPLTSFFPAVSNLEDESSALKRGRFQFRIGTKWNFKN